MVVNVVIIGLVALIAYWWANQGLFSAIIHLLCVIVAGAVALAFWEMLAFGLLMRGGFFDHYALGASLLITFALVLFILRLTTNKLVPANIEVPKWANLAFGYPVGGASGILTVGLLVIGLGLIQSQRTILSFVGYGRTQAGTVGVLDRLWLPVHQWTSEFYSLLSVGALSTSSPLRHYNPDLYQQALSLARDSYNDGRGQVSMRPSQASVQSVWVCPELCVVQVRFARGARDYGDMLTVSASQVRLIARAAGTDRAAVAFPTRWRQEIADGDAKIFAFDDVSHYATTVPGRETADILFEFPWREGLVPRFIQIKSARLELKNIAKSPSCNRVLSSGGTAAAITAADFAGVRRLPSGADPRSGGISLSSSIAPVSTSTNMKPGSIEARDKRLSEGVAVFPRERVHIGRALRIDNVYEPKGTRAVQVDVSRGRPGSIFGRVAEDAGDNPVPMLVDSKGHIYTAIGYIHERADGIEIRLHPRQGLAADQVPHLPTSGNQKLRMIFLVTVNSTIIGLQYGDVSVARCNLTVTARP